VGARIWHPALTYTSISRAEQDLQIHLPPGRFPHPQRFRLRPPFRFRISGVESALKNVMVSSPLSEAPVRADRVCRDAVAALGDLRALARRFGLPRDADEHLAELELETIAAASYLASIVADHTEGI